MTIEEALENFARFEFQMARPGEDGVSLRDKLKHVQDTTGTTPLPLQDAPECPFELEHIWKWFLELNGGRTSNGFGPNAVTFAEIHAWSILTGNTPSPWEVGMLKRLDSVYLKEMQHG